MQKIIITGPSASGKNYLAQKFIEKGYLLGKLNTTRPKRNGDVNDEQNYVFLNKSTFQEIENLGHYVASQWYNDWGYGLHHREWRIGDIFILTPAHIQQLKEKNLLGLSFIIYLDPDPLLRENRLIQRADNNDSFQRRMAADENDFKDFNDYDIRITNFNC